MAASFSAADFLPAISGVTTAFTAANRRGVHNLAVLRRDALPRCSRGKFDHREEHVLGRQIGNARVDRIERADVEGKRHAPAGFGAHRLDAGQQQKIGAQRQSRGSVEDRAAVRNRNVFLAEDNASHAGLRREVSKDLKLKFE